MKAFDIALRDMLRSTRSAFSLMFMFVMPLTIVGILWLSFGGMGRQEEDGFDLPTTHVLAVNLDQPTDLSGSFVAGDLIVEEGLRNEGLAGLIAVAEAADEVSAKAAVDAGEAGVAVIIPADFTAAAFSDEGEAAITLYSDPTLTIGPGIVKGVVSAFVDAFSGTRIAVSVVSHQLEAHGLEASPAELQAVVGSYLSWVNAQSEQQSAGSAIDVQSIENHTPVQDADSIIFGSITAAMMIFYVFFTGSAVAQSIIAEEHEGTLRRLFSAPITIRTILTGKVIGSVLTLTVETGVLLGLSRLIFGVRWGQPLPVMLAATALVLLSSSFGIFVMSLVKNPNNVGIIYGGVMTITGIVGTYSSFIPSMPQAIKTAALIVPQGWAMRIWTLAMEGDKVSGETLLVLGVSMAISLILFAIGVTLFRRRFE